MLTKRKEKILKLIVGEYISTAIPVPSAIVARGYLGVSPATIRLEMAGLEEEGFIVRPHHSAGGVPSDKGYRYFVDYLEEVTEPPVSEKRLIQHLFYQIDKDIDEWCHLAAVTLSRFTGNIAITTKPKAAKCYFKHLELMPTHKFGALLLLHLETKLKQRFLFFDRPASQEELSAIADKLSRSFAGFSCHQIAAQDIPLTPLEEMVTQTLLKMMEVEEQTYEGPLLCGLHSIFNQPEFSQRPRMQKLMQVIEGREWLRQVIPQTEGVKVIIGNENKEEAMQDCSVVISQYGIPEGLSGVIGVLGPTRMKYGRVISTVRYLSGVLSRLMDEFFG